MKVKTRSSKGQEEAPLASLPSNNALAVGKWLQEMKTHRQDKYKEFRARETLRLRDFRKKMSAEKKAQYSEKSKERVRKARERKKQVAAHRLTGNSKEIPVTRAQKQSQKQKQIKKREYWKLKKREQRSKMSSQKKRRVREKDQYAKMLKREKSKVKSRQPTEPNSPSTSSTCNMQQLLYKPAAKRKALSRCKSKMPHSADMYASIVETLITTASPKKQLALNKRGIDPQLLLKTKEVDEVVHVIKRSCMRIDRTIRRHLVSQLGVSLKDSKHGVKAKVCRFVGVQQKHLRKYLHTPWNSKSVVTRSDAVCASTLSAVENFYSSPDVSTELPNKKTVSQKQSKPKHILQRTIEETFKGFQKKNPTAALSKSKFASLRPKNIVVQSQAKWIQCLCEYCENVDLKLKEINKVISSTKQTCRIKDRYHASDLTMCRNLELYNDLQCIDRKCNTCGVHQIREYLKPVLEKEGSMDTSWKKWGITLYKGKPKKSPLRVQGTLQQLIDELESELATFSVHLFLARWQQQQFTSLIQNPPSQSAIVVMDFSENFTCNAQREVQSAHWTQNQVTLHPMVAFYHCQSCGSKDPVREAIHIISDDLVHDAHAVNHFVKLVTWYLMNGRGLDMSRLIQWSDGCSAQYKSRTPFMDVAHGPEDTGLKFVERHFFGSRHGKNPCDGEGGVIKNSVTRAVKSEDGIMISDARSFHEFCSRRLTKASVAENGGCQHSRRKFLFVEKQEISRERQDRTNAITLQGTRKLHAIAGLGGPLVKIRRLSCFCTSCENPSSKDPCANSSYTTSWVEKRLRVRNKEDLDSVELIGSHSRAVKDTNGFLDEAQASAILEANEIDITNTEDLECEAAASELLLEVDLPCDIEDLNNNTYETGVNEQLKVIHDTIEEMLEETAYSGDLTKGDWCVVRYDKDFYPGVIENIVGRDFKVSVMVKAGRNMWRWPDPVDCVWYDQTDVLHKTSPPDLVGSRGLFRFDDACTQSEP